MLLTAFVVAADLSQGPHDPNSLLHGGFEYLESGGEKVRGMTRIHRIVVNAAQRPHEIRKSIYANRGSNPLVEIGERILNSCDTCQRSSFRYGHVQMLEDLCSDGFFNCIPQCGILLSMEDSAHKLWHAEWYHTMAKVLEKVDLVVIWPRVMQFRHQRRSG